MITTVIHMRGTKEPALQHDGVSWTFLNRLDRTRFAVQPVAGPYDYGQPTPFVESNRIIRDNAVMLLRHRTGPFVLSGYSAGGYVAGDLANEITAGEVDGVDPERLVGVALLADPKRPEGAGADGIWTPPGYGIAGQRAVLKARTWWGTAPVDCIAALTADSPLRTAADLTRAFTVNPLGWDEWAQDMYDRLVVRRDLQLWWKFGFRPSRWTEAANALAGYLRFGAHTDDYIRRGVCVRLADVVNREVQS